MNSLQVKSQRGALAVFGLLTLFVATPSSQAAAVAYFSQTGVVSLGNPQTFGGQNYTGESVAFELTFDFTNAVDSLTAPIVLWEAGATGSGSALVLENDELHFFAGDGPTDFITGTHGLSGGTNGVQIVSVFDINGGVNGTDEMLSIYVNGSLIASGDFATANIWAGSDAGGLGRIDGGAGARFTNGAEPSIPFDPGTVVNYSGTSIAIDVYRLASSGGDPDNTLANILIPEPTSSAMAMVGLAVVALRRRRA